MFRRRTRGNWFEEATRDLVRMFFWLLISGVLICALLVTWFLTMFIVVFR